jgi:hypothetical protein
MAATRAGTVGRGERSGKVDRSMGTKLQEDTSKKFCVLFHIRVTKVNNNVLFISKS